MMSSLLRIINYYSLFHNKSQRVRRSSGSCPAGWFLDWCDSNVVLVELSGYFVLANHYSAGICTYWSCMGLHHHGQRWRARRWLRLTSTSWTTLKLVLAGRDAVLQLHLISQHQIRLLHYFSMCCFAVSLTILTQTWIAVQVKFSEKNKGALQQLVQPC